MSRRMQAAFTGLAALGLILSAVETTSAVLSLSTEKMTAGVVFQPARSPDRSPLGAIAPVLARRLETAGPTRHILRAVAVDLDRDGDLDVMASTIEEPLIVWLNDGAGRLVQERVIQSAPIRPSDRLEPPMEGYAAQSDPAAPKWPAREGHFAAWLKPNLSADRSLLADARLLIKRPLSACSSRGPPPALLA
jgi:hypothetical protein